MMSFKEFISDQDETADSDIISEGKFSMALAERKIASHSNSVKREKDPVKQNVLIARMIHTLTVSMTYLTRNVK